MSFEKKTPPISLDIAFDEDRILINGSNIDVPSHIDAFVKILGKPRKITYPDERKSRPENVLSSKRVNYSWDSLGIYCLTSNGAVVNTFGIRMNGGYVRPRHFPNGFFGGVLTICGMPWEDAFKTLPYYGEPNTVFKRLDLGIYAANGGYIKKNSPDTGYMIVEIQLKKLR